ncbi:MAG: hypothetical protein HOC20_02760 [Chloroflexi bacterium]|nr:hypothetical protein [Chloroflexota bacterium]
MFRLLGVGLAILMVITAIIVQRQVSDDSVVLVGYGEGSGWSGTNYITVKSEKAREAVAEIELSIREFYDVINAYDKDRLVELTANDDGTWQEYLDYAESMDFTFRIDKIGVPSFDEETCKVQVTITATSPTVIIQKPTTTLTIELIRDNSQWRVS